MPAAKAPRKNEEITVGEVRLIDENDAQLGVIATPAALKMAREKELDLVEVSPTAKPPVCKIMDYGKFKYQQTKKTKESKKHQAVVVLKEIKFRPMTDDHDLDFKIRNIIRFLDEGNKVKATVVFRGREMAYREGGKKVLEYVLEQTKEKATMEVPPKMEGRQMMMILTPGNKK